MLYFPIGKSSKDAIIHLLKLATLMIYPILGAGQNAQNIDFPKSVP